MNSKDIRINKFLKKVLSGRLTLLKIVYVYAQIYLPYDKKRLRAVKNKYLGQSLYIVATGPSLSLDDLNWLHANNCICLSVNKIYRLFDKTKWRPDFYLASDGQLLEQYGDEILQIGPADIPCILYNCLSMKKIRDDAIPFKINWVNNVFRMAKSSFFRKKFKRGRFSKDASVFVYDASTCIIAAIQIAYFMGFSKVYLLGVDCGTKDNRIYAEGMGIERSKLDICEENPFLEMIEDFNCLADTIKNEKIDFCVYNATRGGNLEAFDRVDLEKSLEIKEC